MAGKPRLTKNQKRRLKKKQQKQEDPAKDARGAAHQTPQNGVPPPPPPPAAGVRRPRAPTREFPAPMCGRCVTADVPDHRAEWGG